MDVFTPKIQLSFTGLVAQGNFNFYYFTFTDCVKQRLYYATEALPLNTILLSSQGNMDQFSMLLDHDADPSMGLERTGRNLLHMLATRCTEHDLRTHMKIVVKKVKL